MWSVRTRCTDTTPRGFPRTDQAEANGATGPVPKAFLPTRTWISASVEFALQTREFSPLETRGRLGKCRLLTREKSPRKHEPRAIEPYSSRFLDKSYHFIAGRTLGHQNPTSHLRFFGNLQPGERLIAGFGSAMGMRQQQFGFDGIMVGAAMGTDSSPQRLEFLADEDMIDGNPQQRDFRIPREL